MHFVDDGAGDVVTNGFSYVKYLRMSIYEVCLQLTDIRATGILVLMSIIAFRWARVRL